MGWVAMALAFRGCDSSEGSFSLRGWLADLDAAVAHLQARDEVSGVWVAGFGTGGALAVSATALDPSIRGVAALGAPADFDDWATHPRRLLEHSREAGLIPNRDFPADLDAWAGELRELRAVAYAPKELGRAPVVTPVTTAHILCRLLLASNTTTYTTK